MVEEDVLRFHRRATVVDAHVDTLDALLRAGKTMSEGAPDGQVSTVLLKEGGVDLLVTAMWADQSIRPEWTVHRTLQMVDLFWRTCEDPTFFPVLNRADLGRVGGDRIGLLLAIEGGEALVGDPALLRLYHRLGVRLITLTWNRRNEIADGVAEGSSGGGLTDFGHQVVAEMARLGMVVDLSHISEKGFWDVLEASPVPPVCSHSNSKAVCPNRRNLTDEQALALAHKGGVIGMTFCQDFIRANGQGDLNGFLEHVDHLASLVGPHHLGIGSDFDGLAPIGPPAGLTNISFLPRITEALLKRGYSEKQVEGIIGGNFMDLFHRLLPE